MTKSKQCKEEYLANAETSRNCKDFNTTENSKRPSSKQQENRNARKPSNCK
ncbi:MAG: hypothetical protein PHW00_04135 [Clostridia bacterium]|nr:hypothetical protein [Clostridia bacterium]